MGAAFDDQLIHDVASVVSTEGRAFSNANRAGLDFWTPNINPYKDPRWGRGQETPGEDPYYIQSYVKNLVDDLQGGEDPSTKKVVATCKHFAMQSRISTCRTTTPRRESRLWRTP